MEVQVSQRQKIFVSNRYNSDVIAPRLIGNAESGFATLHCWSADLLFANRRSSELWME